jgi:hypothetical protein
MKFVSFFGLFLLGILAANAQNTVQVTWQVDMGEQNVNPIGVCIAGSFQNPAWSPGSFFMSDSDGDGIYTYTQSVPAGSFLQWKYLNGPTWPNAESVPAACGNAADNNNRFYTVGNEDVVLPVVCYGECQACGVAAPSSPVTFRVDMSNQQVNANGVHVAGSMQGWNPGGTPLSDSDGDGIWEVTLELDHATYQYKFVNGNSWGFDEGVPSGCAVGGNREVVVGPGPVVVQYCFGGCEAACTPPVPAAPITFSVDANQMESVAASGLYLMGSFTTPAWQQGAVAMSDADGDGVWTATVSVSGPAEILYKFNNGNPFEGGVQDNSGEETGNFALLGCGAANPFGGANRVHQRTGVAEVLPTVCFNSCAACGAEVLGCTDAQAINYNDQATQDDGSCYFNPGCTDETAQNYDATADENDNSCQYLVTLRVNLSQQSVSANGVHVAGSFQGWNPGTTPLTAVGFGVYQIVIALQAGTYEYKFINGNAWGTDESVSGCGNGGNRVLVVTGNAQTEAVCFASCEACAGCTDPFSVEFDPYAGVDDGSCETPLIWGCTYASATNFVPTATKDDGSCVFDAVNPCPADIDGDGAVATPDLLSFLAAFGTDCN